MMGTKFSGKELYPGHKKQWEACDAKNKKTKAIPVKDTVTGEIYPSIWSVIKKFNLRSTGLNYALRDGIHPRFKKA